MENLWIYVLLIFIFIVRAIAKSAQKQVNANKKNTENDKAYPFEGEEQRTENDPFSWEDFFPSEPKPQAPAMPVEKSEKKIEKDKIAPAELLIREDSSPKVPEIVTENVNKTTPKKFVVIDDAYNNTQDNADLLPYGTEELRKAVIASEILAKKF